MTAESALETTREDTQAGQTIGIGALAGVIATALFLVVHQVLIVNIWAMFLPMAIAGAICGVAVAWSYQRVVPAGSVAQWFALNSAYVASLLILGVVSLMGFEPTWTFAELNVEDPPLGALFSRALPLMIAFSAIAALAIWAMFSRSLSALAPVMVAEASLVLLLGHNVAIIGLVELTAEGWSLVWLMFGLVVFLGLAFTLVYAILARWASERRIV